MPASESRLSTEFRERLARVKAHNLTLIFKAKHVSFTLSDFFHIFQLPPVALSVETSSQLMVCIY